WPATPVPVGYSKWYSCFSSCSDSDYCSVVLSAGAPSAPGCLAASGRQARLRQAAAGAPASLRRTRWRGFGLSLRSDA
ncbi:hypothetical protein MZH68_26230, partial [Escherichia coli]|nr:hypothetical protein [Escherichia coli]